MNFFSSNSYTYDDLEVITHVISSTKVARKLIENDNFDLRFDWSIFFSFAKAAQLSNGTIQILDFGGAAGIYFDLFKSTFECSSLNWVIIEGNEFVTKLSNEQMSENIEVYSELNPVRDKFKTFDMVILNSVLQYLVKPFDIIKEILQFQPKVIHIGKTPMSKDRLISGLQFSKLESHGPCHIPLANNYEIENRVNILDFDSLNNVLSNNYENVIPRKSGDFEVYEDRFRFFKKKTMVNTYDFSCFGVKYDSDRR